MTKINFTALPTTFNFGETQKHGSLAFIKKQAHEKHIDEFFRTNFDAPKKKNSLIAFFTSVAGVGIPLLLIGKKQKPEIKMNSIKNILKIADINYDFGSILTLGVGGVLGGLIGGLADKNERKKSRKLKEGAYQLMNVALPALFVTGGIKFCESIPKLNKSIPKIAATGTGIWVGVHLAVWLANKFENKIFDPQDISPDRKFKNKDLLVHADDLVGALVLAKMPFMEKFKVGRALPFIFAWCGYHVGDKQ